MTNIVQTNSCSATLIEDQPYEEYAARHEFLRSSLLKQILVTPWHFQHSLQNPKKETVAMTKGTALHAALLEPESFQRRFAVVPKIDRRVKDGKLRWQAFVEANRGKTLIQTKDVKLIQILRRSISQNSRARALLTMPGTSEASLYWTDVTTGVKLKARMDRLITEPSRLLLEVKSTGNATKRQFQKKIIEYDYHFSLAMYREGLKSQFGEYPPVVFLVIEDETWQICLYSPDRKMLAEGHRRFRSALDTFAKCRGANQWPGYQPNSMIEEISLPRWASRATEQPSL